MKVFIGTYEFDVNSVDDTITLDKELTEELGEIFMSFTKSGSVTFENINDYTYKVVSILDTSNRYTASLERQTKAQLVELANNIGLTVDIKMKKSELIDAIHRGIKDGK